jgi:UDP-glucose 4-epimerase
VPRSLVTGGAGFIGSNLVDALVGVGHDVVCVDNESSESNERFHWNGMAENHKVDICDKDSMMRLMAGADYVFHLAAAARIGITMSDPVGTFRTNALGTATVLECARANGVRRLVFSSTSSVYGRNPVPNRESQRPDPLNPYSASKAAGEIACRMYWDAFGLPTITLRYFNVYGPREPQRGIYAPVVGIFRRQIESGDHLTVVGDGLQRRDFTHVYDVARANIMAAEADLPEGCLGEPFNIGSGKNLSVLEIADMMSERRVHVPARKGEMRETLADNSRAMDSFGWRPAFRIEDYIRSAVRD